MNVRRAARGVQRVCPRRLPDRQLVRSSNSALLLRLLVCADHLRLLENMSPHGCFERGFVRLFEIGECGIECVELEEVAMSSNRRARTAVASLLPIVLALARARGKLLRSFGKAR